MSMNGTDVAWLTVITIVKDDLAGFRRSIDSLSDQELDGVEFVVVDSSSESSRSEVEHLAAEFPGCVYVWTQPEGVYSAMNTGLRMASGTFVYFLNAGDLLLPAALTVFSRLVTEAAPEWAFGQVAFVDAAGVEIIPDSFDYEAERQHFFARGRFPSHQGTLVRRETLIKLGSFDLRYRIAADYAVMLQLAQQSTPAITDQVVSRFFLGGLSSTHWRQSLREFHRARISSLGLSPRSRVREGRLTLLLYVRMLAARIVARARKAS